MLFSTVVAMSSSNECGGKMESMLGRAFRINDHNSAILAPYKITTVIDSGSAISFSFAHIIHHQALSHQVKHFRLWAFDRAITPKLHAQVQDIMPVWNRTHTLPVSDKGM